MKRIFLINGPSASGKSTIAQKLREKLLEETGEEFALFSIDTYFPPAVNTSIWEDDVYMMSEMMGQEIAKALRENRGIIIDHMITSERIYETISRAVMTKQPLTIRDVMQVRVVCSLETLKERERENGRRAIGTAENSFLYLYPTSGYDLSIDTGRVDVDTAVAAILSNC